MTQYRKKPVIIEADVYQPGMEDGFTEDGTPYISTLEGDHKITEGDFIITGVKGERYPCKNDIFWMTYEKVENKKESSVITPTEKLILDEFATESMKPHR